MKAVIGLVVLIGLVVGGVYMYRSYKDFDPTKQGEEAKTAITPGMTWQQVIGAAGEPPGYKHISLQKERIGNKWVEVPKPGTRVAFDRPKFEGRIAGNDTPHGFIFCYRFSERCAFDVNFDSGGKVIDVADTMTMADLLQTR